MALTGLGLCLFLLIHMAGNLLILSGPSAYNKYAYSLHEFPLFILLEMGLALFFAGHILLSFLLLMKNKKARGSEDYKIFHSSGGKASPWRHRFLWFQAGGLFIFLILHLLSFKFGPYYETQLEGQVVRDIYRLVVENFKKPIYPIGYSLVLLILFVHLLRGFSASFKSLGLSRPIYVFFVEKLAWLLALVVTFGFLAPIWYVFIWI